MGHKLTDNGVEPDPAKVAAITEMPQTTDKAGVQRFLGMCQYLSKFCHNLSETVLPLRDLTKEDSVFLWSSNHENAFNSPKDLITSTTVVYYYEMTSLFVLLRIHSTARKRTTPRSKGVPCYCVLHGYVASVPVWEA